MAAIMPKMLPFGRPPSQLPVQFTIASLLLTLSLTPACALNMNTLPNTVHLKHPSENPLFESPNKLEAFNVRCYLCKQAVVKYRARLESRTAEAEAAIGGLCKDLKLQKEDVCDGIVKEFGPEIITVLAERLFDPVHLCVDVLHYCPHEPSGRVPSELPCNKTRLWALEQGLISEVDGTLHLLQRQTAEPVALRNPREEDFNRQGSSASADDQGSGRQSTKGTQVQRSAGDRPDGDDRSQQQADKGGRATARKDGAGLKQESVGHLLQMTDIHLDMDYTVGSEVNCGRPLCCRKEDGPAKSNVTSAAFFGDYKCDASPALFESLAEFVADSDQLPPLDFAVFTGDVPPHDVWEESQPKTLAAMEFVYSRLAVALKSVPLYPVLGNHAGVPVDAFPDPPVQSWLMDASWEYWKRWLPADAEATVRKGGYYTLLHADGLRIVGLNTQYCDTLNFWLLTHTSEPDPAGQLEWLGHVLMDAENAGEKVLISGHIPIGDDACYVSYSQRYELILDRFKDTVAAQIFGHTHSDSFKLYYDSQTLTEPVGVGFIAPSVTPYTGRNPSFRVFDYDRSSTAAGSLLLDYKQYMLDLDSANSALNGSRWALEYGAKAAYNLTDMSPRSWHALLQRLQSEPALLGDFLHRREVSRPFTCNEECRKGLLCNIKSQTFALDLKCIGGQILGFSALLKVILNGLFLC